jgi:hypothetical protein
MDEIDFTKDMTTEEIAAAKEAGALAAEQLSGQTLLKGLKVGEQLVFGRKLILHKYGLKAPRGQPYGQYFQTWKVQFGFPVEFENLDHEKQVKAYFDDAILCASQRDLAEEIVYQLGPKWRANNGVSALARRIRDILRDRKGKAKAGVEDDGEDMTKTRRKTGEEIVADAQKELAELRAAVVRLKDNPFPWWTGSPEAGARSMYEDRGDGRRADGRARSLLLALAREFKANFPNQTAQLLDELAAILRTPSESVDAAAVKAVDVVVKEGAKQAKTVRRAGRMAKREAAQGGER